MAVVVPVAKPRSMPPGRFSPDRSISAPWSVRPPIFSSRLSRCSGVRVDGVTLLSLLKYPPYPICLRVPGVGK